MIIVRLPAKGEAILEQPCSTSVPVPLLVIVTGPPGTGKTLLSKRLADELHLLVLNRDTLKELLFDTLGWSDRAWSKQLGIASYRLLYYMLATLLRARCSCVVESNFDHHYDTPRLLELQHQFRYRACQIVCHTEPTVLLRRLQQRVGSGERHPGHVDHLELAELDIAEVPGYTAPLEISGLVIDVDTTDFATIDYAGLVAQIQNVQTQPESW